MSCTPLSMLSNARALQSFIIGVSLAADNLWSILQGFQSFPGLACRFIWCPDFENETGCMISPSLKAHFISNTTIKCTTNAYTPLNPDCSKLVTHRRYRLNYVKSLLVSTPNMLYGRFCTTYLFVLVSWFFSVCLGDPLQHTVRLRHWATNPCWIAAETHAAQKWSGCRWPWTGYDIYHPLTSAAPPMMEALQCRPQCR